MPVETDPGEIWIYNVPFTDAKGAKPRPVLITSMPNSMGDVMGIPGTSKVDQWHESYQQVVSPKDMESGKLTCRTLFPVSKQMLFSPRFFAAKVGAVKKPVLEKVLRHVAAFHVDVFDKSVRTPQPFIPGETHVPVSGKVIGAPEIRNLVDASLDAWLTTGRFNEAFEKRLRKFLGVKHVLTVNSGSSANLVAFSALTSPKLGKKAIKPGNEVIAVAAGFPTTVNPVIQHGCVPVFVDVDIPTYNIDTDRIEAAISDKTKAIMIAHTLGNPFNLKKVRDIADKYHLWLIEDCCDALGSSYDGKMVGTFGDIATLSFYPAHQITMGEGGAVFTNSGKLKLILESIRDWGRDCFCAPGKDDTCGKRFCWKLGDLPEGYDHKYIYSHLGYNLKITDMQAAVGLAQMDRLDGFIEARKRNFTYLKSGLKSCEEFLLLPEATPNSDPSWFGFPITIREDAPFSRVDLLQFLDENKIGTRLLFAGNLTKQPYFKGVNYRIAGDLANTDHIMNQTFWIGTFPGLNDEMLSFVVDKLEAFSEMNTWKMRKQDVF